MDPKEKPPMKRSYTPRELRAMREQVAELPSGPHRVLTVEEAESLIAKLPTLPPPRHGSARPSAGFRFPARSPTPSRP